MAINNRIGNKVNRNVRSEDSGATRMDSAPYIGIVKNNVDPTRTGRLQVWIPDLGGNENDQKNWRTVSYASPFMGQTNIAELKNAKPNAENAFSNVPHSYGMWATPPDIGAEVICLFMGGDPLRGYYIACTNSSLSRFMMPGLASSKDVDVSTLPADIKASYAPGQQVPVTEYNPNDRGTFTSATPHNLKKPVHETQYRILKKQGLDRDNVRGTITSSSQRETPSNVFGISTPGRPDKNDPANDPAAFLKKLSTHKVTEDDYRYTTRTGGHTFIMDDGSVIGVDQLVRIRSATGHQIMMHDDQQTLYISHATGDSWIEMTATGAINIYSKAGFNVRSEGSINLHSDYNINLHAGNSIKMRAENKIQQNCSGMDILTTTGGAGGGGLKIRTATGVELKVGTKVDVDIGTKLGIRAGAEIAIEAPTIKENSGGTVEIKDTFAKLINVNANPNVVLQGNGLYVSTPGKIKSICGITPTHEPFNRTTVQYASIEDATSGVTPPAKLSGTTDATKSASGTALPTQATAQEIRTQPPASGPVGPVSNDQMTALNAQLSKASGANGDYTAVGQTGAVGKYQMDFKQLQDLGYVSKAATSNADLTSNPNVWTNKDGINGLDKFLSSSSLQETAMGELSNRLYNSMCANGSITGDMKPEEVAGMLAVAKKLGADAAKVWRTGGAGGVDAQQLFQMGKYAAGTLGPQVQDILRG